MARFDEASATKPLPEPGDEAQTDIAAEIKRGNDILDQRLPKNTL